MIYVERQIMTEIDKRLKKDFPKQKILIGNDSINAKPIFPFVSVSQSDTYTTKKLIDLSGKTNGDDISITINVYSNKVTKAIEEIVSIIQSIEKVMNGFNFTAISTIPMPNMNNNSIHRWVIKYQGRVEQGTFVRK